MVKRQYLVGWVLAALLVVLNISSVGAAVPQAANPNIPVAIGAGGGINGNGQPVYGGTAGITRSTIQNPVNTGTATNVSAIPSINPNETAALYRPGGTYLVTWDETQAVVASTSRYFYGPGITVAGGIGNANISFAGTTTIYFVPANGAIPAFGVLYFGGATAGPGFGVGNSLQLPPGGQIVLPSGVLNGGATVGPVTRISTVTNGTLPAGIYVVARGVVATATNNAGQSATLPTGSVINVTYDGQRQVYNSDGSAAYTTVLVRPITFNPPNGTSTGEPTGADVLTPYTDTAKITVFIGNGYANPSCVPTACEPIFTRPGQNAP